MTTKPERGAPAEPLTDLRQGCVCRCCDHSEGSDCACACHTTGLCSAAPAEPLTDLAIVYHKTVEGEYGCPGATCPGVQRLVKFAQDCVRAQLAAQQAERKAALNAAYAYGDNNGLSAEKWERRYKQLEGELAAQQAALDEARKGWMAAEGGYIELLKQHATQQAALRELLAKVDGWLCDDDAGYDEALGVFDDLSQGLARLLGAEPGD